MPPGVKAGRPAGAAPDGALLYTTGRTIGLQTVDHATTRVVATPLIERVAALLRRKALRNTGSEVSVSLPVRYGRDSPRAQGYASLQLGVQWRLVSLDQFALNRIPRRCL